METAREEVAQETAREEVAALVQERAPAGSGVVFATQVGSRSYNLQREDGGSDVDFAGVYAAPPSAFWGLARPPANLASGGGAKGEAVVDVQVNEVATFANLLLTGNPAAVELMWAEPEKQGSWWADGGEGSSSTEEAPLGTWASLRQHRDQFLSRQFVKQCLAFAQGQIKQAETKPEANGKKVYNALRLLQVAHGVLDGRSLRLWWEGEEREALMAVRRGDVPLPEALAAAKDAARRLDARKPWTALPDKADAVWLDAWLLALRQQQHAQSHSRTQH